MQRKPCAVFFGPPCRYLTLMLLCVRTSRILIFILFDLTVINFTVIFNLYFVLYFSLGFSACEALLRIGEAIMTLYEFVLLFSQL